MEVPGQLSKEPSGTEEFIIAPGASRSRKDAEFEKQVTLSGNAALSLLHHGSLPRCSFQVAPTLMLLDMHAGEAIESVYSSLPEAITVAVPTDRRLSIAAFIATF